MTLRYNPPPHWPQPPAGWVPPHDWQPDPSWGPAPAGWTLWVDEQAMPTPSWAPESAPVHEPRPARASKRSSRNSRIFISYRRNDCQAQANGLYDGLSHRLPTSKIFMDLDSIPPGADFEDYIRKEIDDCDLVFVLIGDNWLDSEADGSGRRIDRHDDFVRLEIESALASPRVHVVPVLVEGARMPAPGELPPSVRALTRYNAVELDDRRWTADLKRLAESVPVILRTPPASVVNVPAAPATPPSVAPRPPVQPVYPVRPVDVVWTDPTARTPVLGWVMIALPLLTCGFAAFVPALWAASQRRGDARYRRRMFVFAAAIGVGELTALMVTGSVPQESTTSDVAVGIVLGLMVVAIVVAVINRNPARGRQWR